MDCEYLTENSFVHQFETKFYDEIQRAEKLRNLSTISTSYYQPESIQSNHKFRHYLRNKESTISAAAIDNDNDDVFGMRNLTYHRLWSKSDIPDDLQPMMSYKQLKIQCDKRHKQMQRIVSDLSSDNQNEKKNATDHLNR